METFTCASSLVSRHQDTMVVGFIFFGFFLVTDVAYLTTEKGEFNLFPIKFLGKFDFKSNISREIRTFYH